MRVGDTVVICGSYKIDTITTTGVITDIVDDSWEHPHNGSLVESHYYYAIGKDGKRYTTNCNHAMLCYHAFFYPPAQAKIQLDKQAQEIKRKQNLLEELLKL